MLSRRQVTAVKWGYSALVLVYYLSALVGKTPYETLGDRRCRLILAQLYYEMHSVLDRASKGFTPDTTGSSSMLSFHMIWSCLPWPDWAFRALLRLGCTFGVLHPKNRLARSPLESDVLTRRQTSFAIEYSDILELAEAYGFQDKGFRALRKQLQTFDTPVDVDVIYQEIMPVRESREPARSFLLRSIITAALTFLLLWWLVLY